MPYSHVQSIGSVADPLIKIQFATGIPSSLWEAAALRDRVADAVDADRQTAIRELFGAATSITVC